MFQIDNSTAATTMPAPDPAGTPGFFTGGSPGAGIPATILPADWLNIVQQEILSVIGAAGITPSKTNNAQLLAAIKAIPAGRYLGTQIIDSSTTIHPGNYGGVTAKTWRVRGCAGGGGGGGAPTSGGTTVSVGTPGLSGAYVEFTTPAVATAVTIGAAGAGGVAGGSGGNGGNSVWGSTAILNIGAGAGGDAIGPFTPPFIGIKSAQAFAGGTMPLTVYLPGSPGTSSSSTSTASVIGGSGGDSLLGRGGLPAQGGDGIDAHGYGAGGGGASSIASTAARPGGAAAPGVFIVDEYA